MYALQFSCEEGGGDVGMTDTITISKSSYLQLQIDSEQLIRLEAGGVGNWEWYGESLNPDHYPSMDEFEETERNRIAAL